MNTITFIFGQLLSLDKRNKPRPQERRPVRRDQLPTTNQQDHRMDNNLLIIAFLIVGLIANFTVLAAADE